MTLARLMVLLTLDATGFNRGMYLAMGQMRALEGSLNTFGNLGGVLSNVGSFLTRNLTLPLLGLVAAATVAGTAFDKNMGQVQTLLQGTLAETTARARELGIVAQDMGIQFGIGTGSMTEGMYEMISAFEDSDVAMRGLEQASRMARAGNIDLLDTVRMLVGQAKVWGDSFDNDYNAAMERFSDLAFKAAAIGQTTLPELVDSIGKVGPMAQQAGVSLEEFFAVFATVPGTVGTTSQVATMFRSVLRSLLDPTKTLTKAYKDMGITSIATQIQQEGFVETLVRLNEYSKLTGVSFGDLIGRVEGWTIAQALATDLNDDYAKSLAAMEDAQGSTAKAFETVTQGIGAQAFTWEQLGVKAQVFLERLQTGLTPALSDLLDNLGPVADKAVDLATAFANLDPATQQQIVNWGLLAVALGPALRILGGMIGIATTLWGVIGTVAPLIGSALLSMAWPLAILMAAITLLAVAWNQNWFGIQERTAAAAAAIKPHVEGIKDAWSNWVSTVAKTDFSSWDGFVASFKANGEAMRGLLSALGSAAMDAINAFFGFDVVGSVISTLKGWIESGKISLASFGLQALVFVAQFVSSFSGALAQVATFVTSVKTNISGMYTYIITQVATFGQRISSGFTSAVAAASSAVSNIRAAFTINWSAIGSSITSGIAGGIRAGIGSIISAAQSAASSAYSAAMSALKARSPSRLMMAVGMYASQGLAIGILNGIGFITNAANRMIAPLATLAVGGGSNLSLAGAGGGGMVIQIENHFNGPVDSATVAQVEEANSRSITAALRGEGYL